MTDTITQQQSDELQALASQICVSCEANAIAFNAMMSARAAFELSTADFDNLCQQLYAMLTAYGVTPSTFALGNYSFAPNDASKRFIVTPSPSLASTLPPVAP